MPNCQFASCHEWSVNFLSFMIHKIREEDWQGLSLALKRNLEREKAKPLEYHKCNSFLSIQLTTIILYCYPTRWGQLHHTMLLASDKNQILKNTIHHEVLFSNFFQCPWPPSTPFHMTRKHAMWSTSPHQ